MIAASGRAGGGGESWSDGAAPTISIAGIPRSIRASGCAPQPREKLLRRARAASGWVAEVPLGAAQVCLTASCDSPDRHLSRPRPSGREGLAWELQHATSTPAPATGPIRAHIAPRPNAGAVRRAASDLPAPPTGGAAAALPERQLQAPRSPFLGALPPARDAPTLPRSTRNGGHLHRVRGAAAVHRLCGVRPQGRLLQVRLPPALGAQGPAMRVLPGELPRQGGLELMPPAPCALPTSRPRPGRPAACCTPPSLRPLRCKSWLPHSNPPAGAQRLGVRHALHGGLHRGGGARRV